MYIMKQFELLITPCDVLLSDGTYEINYAITQRTIIIHS